MIMRTDREVRAKIDALWKRYRHYRNYIKKHKADGTHRGMVDTYSKKCPQIIASINVLNWVLDEDKVRDGDVLRRMGD